MATKTNRRQLKFDKNPIEALREVGSSVMQSAKSEAGLDTNLAWRQLLGTSAKKNNTYREMTSSDIDAGVKEGPVGKDVMHELQEGTEVSFAKKEKKAESAPAIDYVSEILHSEVRISNETNKQLNVKIEELRIEIAKLAKSSKALEVVVKDVTIQQIGPNPGKYHLNFFEWVLATVQTARIRVEESTSWLSAVSTKSSRKDYWSLSKKHGTSFMLSGERVVAQQTG